MVVMGARAIGLRSRQSASSPARHQEMCPENSAYEVIADGSRFTGKFGSQLLQLGVPKAPVTWRRFCSCESTQVQQQSTNFDQQPATGSTIMSYVQQNSTGFDRCWNLVRDQGALPGACEQVLYIQYAINLRLLELVGR